MTSSIGLRRDRLTWLVYVQLATYGYFLYGFGPTVPLLREEQGVSRTLAGLHGSGLAIGALISALVVAPVVRRWGRRLTLWSGLALLCLGITVYVTTTALPLTLFGAFLASFGGSFVVVAVPPVLSDRFGRTGPSAISEANALAAGVGAVAPLVVGAAVGLGLGWRSALLVVLPVTAVLVLVGWHVAVPEVEAAEVPRAGGRRRLPANYWASWAVLVAGIGVEFCLLLWASDILASRLGLAAGVASAGVTAVVAGMCVGRVTGGRLALRFRTDTLLYAATAVASAGFTVFWLTTWAPLAMVGLVVCGLGISLFYPLGIARAIDASQGRPDLATARAGLAAALASGVAPFVLGALADQVGIHKAFLVVPALLAAVALGVRLGGPRRTASAA